MGKRGKRGHPNQKEVFWFIEPCNMQTQSELLDRSYIWNFDVNIQTSEGLVARLYSTSGEIANAKLQHNVVLQGNRHIKYKVYRQDGPSGDKNFQPQLSKLNSDPPVR